MRPLAERSRFRIGLVALAGLVLLGLVVVVLSVVSFGTRSYTAVLENSAGLRPGEDVEVHGVVSGKVGSVAIDGHTVLVTFTLDKSLTLGPDTTAAVKVATLLGTHYLEVDPGGTGSLADGRIPLDHTSVPYNLQDVLDTGTAKLDQLDPVELAKALTAISRTLDPASKEVGPALLGVGRLSALITARSGQTRDLLDAARDVTRQLAGSRRDLVGLMRDTNLVVDEVTRRRTAIHRLLVEATTLSQALRQLIRSTDGDLGPALRDINLALTSLRRQDGVLQKTLDLVAPAVRYVANATGNGPYGDIFFYPPGLIADNAYCKLKGGC